MHVVLVRFGVDTGGGGINGSPFSNGSVEHIPFLEEEHERD